MSEPEKKTELVHVIMGFFILGGIFAVAITCIVTFSVALVKFAQWIYAL